MRKQYFLLFFYFINVSLGAISLKQILDKANGASLSIHCSESLFYGKLYYLLNILKNVRFYHANVDRSWAQDRVTFGVSVRRVEDDVANKYYNWKPVSSNPNLALITRLFPSPTGFIEPLTTHKYNFGRIIRNNLTGGGLDLLAFALIIQNYPKISKNIPKVTFATFDNYIRSGGRYLTIQIDSFKTIYLNFEFPVSASDKALVKRNVFDTLQFLFNENVETEDILLSTNLIVQAFIVQFLNSNNEYDQFIRIYQTYWIRELRNTKVVIAGNDVVSVFREELARYINFPYSESNQPSQGERVNEYVRNENRFLTNQYANCVESTLYHFLNCILWNPSTNSYSFSHSIPQTNPVFRFFHEPITMENPSIRSRPMMGDLPQELLSDFHRIIADLPNGYFIDKFVASNLFTKIAYRLERNGAHNEIYTGFINFFAVIAAIFNEEEFFKSNLEKIYNEFQNKQTHYTALVTFCNFVHKFILRISNINGSELDVTFADYNITNVGVKVKAKPDIFGVVYITRKFQEQTIRFSINQLPEHAYVLVNHMDKLSLTNVQQAKTVYEQFAQQTNCSFLISLFLNDCCNTGSSTALSDPFRENPALSNYHNFIRFSIGNNAKTRSWFKQLTEKLFIYLIQMVNDPYVYADEFNEIASIMINIILAPLPMDDANIVMMLEDFYHLVCFLINIKEVKQIAPSIFPEFTQSQINNIIYLGNSLAGKLPKPKSRPDIFSPEYLNRMKVLIAGCRAVSENDIESVGFVDATTISSIFNFVYLEAIDHFGALIKNIFLQKHLDKMDEYAVVLWIFLHFKINPLLVVSINFNSKKIETKEEKTNFVKELMDTIPTIMRSLQQSTDAKFKNQLLDLLCYAWINSGFEERSEVIGLLSRTMNAKRFFYIVLFMNKEKLIHYFPEKLGNFEFSEYFAKFWFDQFPNATLGNNADFKRWIADVISKVGVPRLMSSPRNTVRQYYDYHWQALSLGFAHNPSYNPILTYSPEMLFFIAEGIHFQGPRELDTSVILRPVQATRLAFSRIRNALENVTVFGISDAERRSITATFMTLFRLVPDAPANTCSGHGDHCNSLSMRKREVPLLA